MKRLLVAVAAAAITIGAAPAYASTPIPAPIGGYVDIEMTDSTTFNPNGNCFDIGGLVDVRTDNEYAFLDYDVEVSYDGPSDWVDGGHFFTDAYNRQFPVTYYFCPGLDRAGTYTASVDLDFYDENFNLLESVTDTDTFRAVEKTGFSGWTKSLSNSGYTLKAKLTRPNTTVYLQRQDGARVRSGKTNSSGWATFTYPPAGGSFRILFPGSSLYTSSATSWTSLPKAGSSLSYAKAKSGARAWRVTANLGGSLKAGKRVYLQKLTNGTWRRTTKSCVTNSYGKCSVTVTQTTRAANSKWYRLNFPGSSVKKAASSSRFHITKR